MSRSRSWVARSLGPLHYRGVSGLPEIVCGGDDPDLALALIDPSHPICREAKFHLQGAGLDVAMGIEGFDPPGQNTFFLVPAESLAFHRIRARLRLWRKTLPRARALLLSAGAVHGHDGNNRQKEVLPILLKVALARAGLIWRPLSCGFQRSAHPGHAAMSGA